MSEAPRRRRGGPCRWTPEREDRLIKALGDRHSRSSAAIMAGVDYKTFTKWLDGKNMPGRGHLIPFATRVSEAESNAHAGALSVINLHINNGSLQAATWYLERCHAERYGKQIGVKNLDKASDSELIAVALDIAKKTVTEERGR